MSLNNEFGGALNKPLSKQLEVGISPCPNDIYLYAGLLAQKIPNPYRFHIHPLQALNQGALAHSWDIIKISLATYPLVQNAYSLCQVGASFGHGYGPKLVFASGVLPGTGMTTLPSSKITIATPSLHSTASFLVRQLYPQLKQEEAPLKDIPQLIADGTYPGGILINESMGLLEEFGLVLVCDLAQQWQKNTGHPLPLGIVVHDKSLSPQLVSEWESLVRASLSWARANHVEALQLTREWAAEKDIAALSQHIKNFTSHADSAATFDKAIHLFLSLWRKP